MSDGYIKGLITGVLASIGIIGLSVLIYFAFFHNSLQSMTASLGYGDYFSEEEYQAFINKESSILNVIKNNYYEKVDNEVLFEGAYDGIMASLGDKYACYYSKTDYDSVNKNYNGEFVGIGIYAGQYKNSNEIVVVGIMEDSPALEAGLQPGDIIIGVDDNDITGYDDMEYAMSFVKGKPGTKVVLVVKRDGETLEFPMIRRKIEQKNISSRMLDDKVGCIQIVSFHGNTPEQFKQALSDLEASGMEKLIIDLRDNPGGTVDSAIDILDIFLDKDVLVASIEHSNADPDRFYTLDPDTFSKPVVILINEQSASAAELFAQSMRDYEKATIIGTTSYGKGVYQETRLVGTDGSAIKYTAGKYYSGKGVCVQGIGIEPDITVKLEKTGENELPVSSFEDNQMKAAVEYLKNK